MPVLAKIAIFAIVVAIELLGCGLVLTRTRGPQRATVVLVALPMALFTLAAVFWVLFYVLS